MKRKERERQLHYKKIRITKLSICIKSVDLIMFGTPSNGELRINHGISITSLKFDKKEMI